MIKDVKYIIKRVIIGLGIIFILSFINKCDVYADTDITFPSYYGWIGNTRFWSDAYYNNYSYANINTEGQSLVIRKDTAISGTGNLAVFNGSIITTSILGNGTLINGLLNISQLNFAGNQCFVETGTPNGIGNNQRLYSFTAYCPIKNGSFSVPSGGNILEMSFGVNTGIWRIGISSITTASNTDPNIQQVITLLQQLRQNNIYQLDVQQLIRQYLNSYDSVLMQSIINGNNNVKNAIVDANNSIKQVDQSIKDTNDTLKDSNTEDPSGSINDAKNKVATNGTITDLVLLPVTLYTKILGTINGSCSNYNLGELMGHYLILPCINVGNYIGNVTWNIIDIILSGMLIYAISRKFVKVFNEFSQMKEGDIID